MPMIELPDGAGVNALGSSSRSLASQYEIFVTSEFSAADLMIWWNAYINDPARIGSYIDPLPEHLDDFLALASNDSLYFFLLYHRGQVFGASWLHDIIPVENTRSAWMALYHAPQYRGIPNLRGRDQRAVFYLAERLGVKTVNAACRSSNNAARRSILSSGFMWIAHLDDFASFGGSFDSAEIYTLRPQDADICRLHAEIRATHHRRYRHST